MLSMKQIKAMAKKFRINPVGFSRTELVRRIQTAEGNFPCYRTAEKTCDRTDCLWLDDCVGKSPDGGQHG